MTPTERVRRLIQAGTVAPAEGERLLHAMSGQPAPPLAWLLINPFDRFGGGVAAVVGLVVSGLSIWTTRVGIRFDGFLDLHVPRAHVASIRSSVMDQIVAWILPAVCFWGCARLIARHARPVDFLGMVGLARLPLLLAAFSIALLSPEMSTVPPKVTPSLVGISVIAVACVAWNITLLYQGFKNASGLRGATLVGSFIAMLLVAEGASKLALAMLLEVR